LGGLSLAQQQMVEIARALSMNAEVIIMDEPTDALTEVETEILFKVVADLRDQGKGLVFISHRLNEIFTLCDEVAILRDGEMVHQGSVADIDEDTLIRHMVGRELSEQYPYVPAKPDKVRLTVENLSADGVDNVSFEAKAGEVVGFAGLVGAGRTELAKTIYGANRSSSGLIIIDGVTTDINSPLDGVKAGIGYVTEDRKLEGLIQSHGLQQNLSLTGLFKFSNKLGVIDKKAERAEASKYINAFSIKTHGVDALVSQLSGGNQQKVSIAKSLVPEPRILILDEPTRGVDVGAKREIYALINQLKSQGLCILLMSSDMPELLGISDRILVMSQGRLTGSFSHDDADQESILRCTVSDIQMETKNAD
jgi:ribose transport system ATP-binding protein